VATKAVAQADFNWGQFLFAQAHAEYLVSLEGYMGLLKITQDDPAFQQYLKGQMNYLLDKVILSLATYVGLQMQAKGRHLTDRQTRVRLLNR